MAINLEDKPKLRWPLDVQYFEAQGRRFAAFRDGQGVARDPLVLPVELLPIVSRLDGETMLAEILREGAPWGVTEALLAELVRDLDELSYLDTPGTRAAWELLKQQYRASPVREAAHAGRVYPADPKELEAAISRYLSKAGTAKSAAPHGSRVAALMCPHIDYHRGWQTYSAVHEALSRAEVPDIIIMLGTAHQAADGIFHLTRKRFVTPFGAVDAARDVIEQIAARFGETRLFAEEILHRTEHSLELQLPFLQHCYRKARMPLLVPVLVGSFHRFFLEGRSPIEDGEVRDFVGALAEALVELRRTGVKVLLYGGVDLAHIGRFFGDSGSVSRERLGEIEASDRVLLECVVAGDEQALFEHLAQDHDARRICGYPSLYTMLAAARRAQWRLAGRCLEYRQAFDAASDCLVTFAGAVWTNEQ
ncbi:MAG: AmmeMemoRadiSam system protein B [Bdellovibrionales bacterium]|nr:AmmeMemoRadiSam system protein B [Bdellovibrionales bacterium]